MARRERQGVFTPAQCARAIAGLKRDLAAWTLVEVTAEVTADAQALFVRHGLRTGDAIQLASALYLQREIAQRLSFGAFDDRLNGAARTEGLTLTRFP